MYTSSRLFVLRYYFLIGMVSSYNLSFPFSSFSQLLQLMPSYNTLSWRYNPCWKVILRPLQIRRVGPEMFLRIKRRFSLLWHLTLCQPWKQNGARSLLSRKHWQVQILKTAGLNLSRNT